MVSSSSGNFGAVTVWAFHPVGIVFGGTGSGFHRVKNQGRNSQFSADFRGHFLEGVSVFISGLETKGFANLESFIVIQTKGHFGVGLKPGDHIEYLPDVRTGSFGRVCQIEKEIPGITEVGWAGFYPPAQPKRRSFWGSLSS